MCSRIGVVIMVGMSAAPTESVRRIDGPSRTYLVTRHPSGAGPVAVSVDGEHVARFEPTPVGCRFLDVTEPRFDGPMFGDAWTAAVAHAEHLAELDDLAYA